MWAEVERPICDVGEVERRVWNVGSGMVGHRLLQSEEGMVGALCMFMVVIVGASRHHEIAVD